MTATMKLTAWHAEEILKRVRKNIANAINETAADAVSVAQELAPRDTGFMANTIEVVHKAEPNKLTAIWGNVTAKYTIWQEIGARGRSGRHFLRGGAERAYPGLKGRMEKIH